MHCEGDKVYQKQGDCPVCNMHLVPVDINDKHIENQHIVEHPKPDYKAKTEKSDKHLEKTGSTQKSDEIYTCPMHPEVKSDKPGSCPKCGMTLVPEKQGEEGHEDDAYFIMLKKFRMALLFTIPVFIIAMSDLFSFLHLETIVSKKVWSWIEFILTTPVVFYCCRRYEFQLRISYC